MSHEGFSPEYRVIGRSAAWAVFILIVIYAVTTTLGFLSLKSAQDQIGDPYFSIMELLILLLVPLLILCMTAIHAYTAREAKPYSFTALVFMIIMGVITSGLHFVILTVSRPIAAAGFASAGLLFSFKCPAVAYTLDILAWDWFYALAILFAVPVFKESGLERALRYVMIVGGVLSLIGLLGVPLAIMNVGYWLTVRNVGIVGYALLSPIAFLLLALVFGRTEPRPA